MRDEEDPRNCGIDLYRNDGDQSVYVYTGGIISFYTGTTRAGSGTVRILKMDENSTILRRFNYTHISIDESLGSSGKLYSHIENQYIASGILLGIYGPYGAYGGDEHVDTVCVEYESGNQSVYANPPYGGFDASGTCTPDTSTWTSDE